MSKTQHTVTAYATLHAFKVVTVEAETPQAALILAQDRIKADTDLQDGWTAMSELTPTEPLGWDLDMAHDKVLARPTGLLDDATLGALVWMVRNEVEASYERVANGGMDPEDRLNEVEDVDRVIAFLEANGAESGAIKSMRGGFVNEAVRAEIERELRAKRDAEMDAAERAMARFDLDDGAWDALPDSAQQALIEAAS